MKKTLLAVLGTAFASASLAVAVTWAVIPQRLDDPLAQYPRNAMGLTYGHLNNEELAGVQMSAEEANAAIPDLVWCQNIDGQDGYFYKYAMFCDLEEIPVFLSDGHTQVGVIQNRHSWNWSES
ncbi:hypothetical protein QJ043_00370 [Olsenella sp. YH-ols2217]|uniref:Uncharacterized protein n=1 Tax=Kribbibacterium absianum TaxID=3044210 RepID=A0ABT6ZHK9_9ACTN|nr:MULTISPECIES: hypothetical protein [unclassified Olsenella]MDJ1121051.1 hypothetical protein [Olsenella sp. YH-ols2216]MDJ1128542.1 hypothetical protein [Olsenella sp. YH-ols2217]